MLQATAFYGGSRESVCLKDAIHWSEGETPNDAKLIASTKLCSGLSNQSRSSLATDGQSESAQRAPIDSTRRSLAEPCAANCVLLRHSRLLLWLLHRTHSQPLLARHRTHNPTPRPEQRTRGGVRRFPRILKLELNTLGARINSVALN